MAQKKLMNTLIKRLIINTLFLYANQFYTIDLYFCTAANSSYFSHLINLIGSIHYTNFEALKEIAIFDLGLEQYQIDYLNTIQKVNIYKLERMHPDILQLFQTNNDGRMVPGWYAWKPVVIKQALDLFPYVLWVDAGTTILRSLEDLFRYIRANGYFLTTIGDEKNSNGSYKHPVGWGATAYVKNKFNLKSPENKHILSKESIMGGVIGVAQRERDKLIIPLYLLSANLKNYEDDGTTTKGFGTGRHDQTLLSIIAYQKKLKIFKQDYKQRQPIMLKVKEKEIPFYITWESSFISEKTHIYSSRSDLRNFDFYKKYLKFNEKK